MTTVEIPSQDNEVKILYVEPLRRIESEDINTATGVNFEGSQLKIATLVARAIIGKDLTDTCYLGFKPPSFASTEISVQRGVIITEEAVFQIAPTTLTPTPEARYGIYECEFVEEIVDEEARDFWNAATEEADPAMSPTRKRFGIKVYEKYNTSASYPAVTPGRFELLRYQKLAAFQAIDDVQLQIQTDFDLITVTDNISQLFSELSTEIAERQSADDLKNFIRTSIPGPPGNQVFFRQDGNYLYWSNDGSTWRPFA